MPCLDQKHHVKQWLTHLDRVAQFTVRQQPCRAPQIAMLCRAERDRGQGAVAQALVLIEGAVPLSSTFDAQALDRTALQFEAVKRSLCFAW